jgi:T6SS, Phospholipase effector Tle1-like, catalytic domain
MAGELIERFGGPTVDDLPRHDAVRIRFVGVYDTVGALGVPLPAAAEINEPIVGFHNTALCGNIDHGVHALALDERRGPYTPTLWTEDPEMPLATGQSVLQVWFPGVHSDVGGGYRDKGIGDVTLEFMLRQAARRGLIVDPDHPTPDVPLHALPRQHESFNARWTALCDRLRIVPEGVRAIGPTVPGPDGERLNVLGEARLHPSLVTRLGQSCVTFSTRSREPSARECTAPPTSPRRPCPSSSPGRSRRSPPCRRPNPRCARAAPRRRGRRAGSVLPRESRAVW